MDNIGVRDKLMSPIRRIILPFSVFLFCAIFFSLPFFIEPPGRDQGLFLTQADFVMKGMIPYRDFFEHKPPGVIYLYTIAMMIFGRSYTAVHILNFLAGYITALGIYLLLMRVVKNKTVSILAGVLYLIHASGLVFGGYWVIGQAEIFMDPICVTALLLLLNIIEDKRSGYIDAFVAGLLLSSMFLIKYSALPMFLLGPLSFFLKNSPVSKRIRLTGLYCAGYITPVIMWFLFMLILGGFPAFWQATVVFNMAHRGVSASKVLPDILNKIFYGFTELLPLYLFMFVTFLFGAGEKIRSKGESVSEKPIMLFSLLWCLCLAQVFWQRKFWIYHFHVVLLPLSLLFGTGLSMFFRFSEKRINKTAAITIIISILSLSSIPYVRTMQKYNHFHRISDRLQMKISEDDFLSTYTWGPTDYNFLETKKTGERIRKITSPNQTIFVWGFEPYIYFLSARLPASRFLYDYPLMARFKSVHTDYAHKLLSDLKTNKPALFIVLLRDQNDIEARDSYTQLKDFTALMEIVDTSYEPLWRFGDFICFRRTI